MEEKIKKLKERLAALRRSPKIKTPEGRKEMMRLSAQIKTLQKQGTKSKQAPPSTPMKFGAPASRAEAMKKMAMGGNVSDSPTAGAVFDKSDMAGGNQTSNYGKGGKYDTAKDGRRLFKKRRRRKNKPVGSGRSRQSAGACAAYFEDGGKYATAKDGRRLFGRRKKRRKNKPLGSGRSRQSAGACAAYYEQGGRNNAYGIGGRRAGKPKKGGLKNVVKKIKQAVKRKPKQCAAYR